MTTKEETYKVTVHLIDGTKHKVYLPVTTSEMMDMYQLLSDGEGRIKYPTAADTIQFVLVRSILRIEAKGDFE